MSAYDGPDISDHSKQSDNNMNTNADDNRAAERQTNIVSGYDSDIIYDLDTEEDD